MRAKAWVASASSTHSSALSGLTLQRRIFESPRLAAGSDYKYTVTVKLPDGQMGKKEVTGKPGDTLKVDFTEAGK